MLRRKCGLLRAGLMTCEDSLLSLSFLSFIFLLVPCLFSPFHSHLSPKIQLRGLEKRSNLPRGALAKMNSVHNLASCGSNVCIVTKLNDAQQIFRYHTKGNHSSFSTPTVVVGRRPLPREIFAKRGPPPSKNASSRHKRTCSVQGPRD